MVETVRSGPTMAMVARMAGVSVPTVSKVVNGRGGVAAATRDRVTAALRQVGYLRSPSTPLDQRGSGRLVDVVMHGLRTTYAADVLGGIEAAASEAGLDVVVAASEAELRRRESPSGGRLDHLIDDGQGESNGSGDLDDERSSIGSWAAEGRCHLGCGRRAALT